MNFLLLGASGLLGRHLHSALLASDHSVIALTHPELDIRDSALCTEVLDKVNPEVVINAAAFCSFDGCERDSEHSRQVNLEAPLWWSEECAKRGVRLVLFSSDYIFDGEKKDPYGEEDPASPLNVYGHHKAALESSLKNVPTNLIFRPAWIFGIRGKTFMSLMPDLFCTREQLEVASGKLGSCLHAADGARTIIKMAEGGHSGLWNLVHAGATSWEEFANECLLEMRARGYPVRCDSIITRPFEHLASGCGQRPRYSVLNTCKLDGLPGIALPPWRIGLRGFLDSWAAEKGI
jgi:dTDP-4-dehydrorhamnose reductase